MSTLLMMRYAFLFLFAPDQVRILNRCAKGQNFAIGFFMDAFVLGVITLVF